ncbi:MAG: outer membrane protein assembly factor BamE [Alphaproteobacteria bacterium]|nr:outer membrane protein assembly factor BamE [Alphaproteobacteria bacterium]
MKNIHSTFLPKLLVYTLCFFLGGCQAKIYSGTLVSDQQIASIATNQLSKEQVQDLLGSPDSVGISNKDSWYYVYREMTKRAFLNPVIKEQIVVKLSFQNDKAINIEKLSSLEYGTNLLVEDKVVSSIKTKSPLQEYIGNMGRFYQHKKKENRRG